MIRKFLCCLLLVLLAGATAAAELVVVVSARSPITALRAEQVADIFLSEATRFPDGGEVVALDLPIGSPLRDDFYLKVANRSPALMKAYWTKKIFTGRGQPPRELPNSQAVRKLVADNPTLIGYIDRSALDASVRPVLVVH
ncbi:phosphate ABC transporter substrate-binding protein [Pseudoduganella sp. S-14]|jgi:ABC-type phosphate transport system substrate-binding protein|uniref:phosphate ABC transporter substrate-binding protein n=1 Tax=Pseudoduganella sp. S-14 TaxID=3404065 RepID=UPI003CF6CE41